MMSTLWTVAAVCLCLGGHPRSETSELKKAIVRMQDLYHVNFVYDSSLEMIRLSGIFSSGKSLKENLTNSLFRNRNKMGDKRQLCFVV